MTDYPHGYCGMPCALCTRCRTAGKSRCPGCSCDGYYTEPCKVHHCCRSKKLEQCGECPEFPCVKLGNMGDFRDLNTNNAKMRNCRAVASAGFEAWYAEYAERADMLTEALENYNDGRLKRFLCELFIRRSISDLRDIMLRARNLTGTLKEKGKALRELAESSSGKSDL